MKLKKRALVCFALAALACAPHAPARGQEPAWSRYTFPGEEFSVELPGAPAVYNRLRGLFDNRPLEQEKMRVFSLYRDGVIYFLVSYNSAHATESFDFLVHFHRGAWQLSPRGPLALGDFQGESYKVAAPGGGNSSYEPRGEGRIFRANRHVYFALAFANGEARPEVGRFLDSLTIGEKPAGLPVADEQPVPAPPKSSGHPAQGGGDASAFRAADVERRAVIFYKPEPGFTEEARAKNIRGTVSLSAVLSGEGTVTDILPVKRLPGGLTEKAIGVARQIRFFPAMKGGRPVPQHVRLEYNFTVE